MIRRDEAIQNIPPLEVYKKRKLVPGVRSIWYQLSSETALFWGFDAEMARIF